MSKLFVIVCAVSAFCAISALAANPHGTCGADVRWELDLKTGVFTMNGTGPMNSYEGLAYPPWFSYRDEILSVIVSEGVTSIGAYAFFLPHNLTSVQLPSTVTSIGTNAFDECFKLASINIPQGLKYIDRCAFNGCAIPYIKLPKTVEYVGFNVFGDCHELTAIDVDPENPNLKSIDGVLFNKTVPNLLQYPAGKPGDYKIPSFVESVTGNAFIGAERVTSVVVPPSMTAIPTGMLFKCLSLKSVSLPDTITSIGSYAFERCISLETFVIPAKVTSFGHSVFANCTNLKAVSYLGSYEPAFVNYTFLHDGALKMICVPESYNSTKFCDSNITCKSSSCGLLNSQCHDWSAKGDTCSFPEKEKVMKWKNNTNECVEYLCDNQEGFIAKSKCGDKSMQCIDDKCFKKDEVENKKWVVYIEFNTSDVVIPESGQLVKELAKLSKVDEYDMKVVIEYDGEGGVKRVIVYVDDEYQATDITEAVNKLDKGASCEGILCKSEKAKTEEYIPMASGANHMRNVMAMFVAMVFILLSIH